MFYRKKKESSAYDRTADNAESLETERDSQAEAALTVNVHLNKDMASVKNEEKENEDDMQDMDENQRLTGEQDRGGSRSQDDTAVNSTHSQSKASSSSRRPSYVLATYPNRRNSCSIQYVKAAWSQLTHRGEHRPNTNQEEMHDVGTEIVGECDEDALLSTEDQTHSRASSFRSRLMKILKQLRSGSTKSLKDLKLFMRWALIVIHYPYLPVYLYTQ